MALVEHGAKHKARHFRLAAHNLLRLGADLREDGIDRAKADDLG
jgi:hypothetical protein